MRAICNGVGIYDSSEPVVKEKLNSDGKREIVWKSVPYSVWKSMIHRCYSNKGRFYKGVTVCEEWKTYSNFKKWFDDNYIEGYELDKDLKGLFRTSNYSPNNCMFIPRKMNTFLIGMGMSDTTKGVQYMPKRSKCYRSQINITGSGMKCLGWFETELEAHKAWLLKKIELISIFERNEEVVFIKQQIRKLINEMYECYHGDKFFNKEMNNVV